MIKKVVNIIGIVLLIVFSIMFYLDFNYNKYYFHTDVSSFYLKSGNSQQIKIYDTDDLTTIDDYIIESSDESILSILENGFIKANSVGKASVTITSKKNNQKEIVDVTIGNNYNNEVDVSKIMIQIKMDMKVGEKKFINYTVLPENATNKSVTWTSSNSNVAIVNSIGKVTALKEGTTILTIKSMNGKIEKKCTINVTKSKTVDVKSISLIKKNANVEINKSIALDFEISPNNASNQDVTWTSSNMNVAVVSSNGVVTGVKEGNTIITVKTENGKTDTCKVTVSKKSSNVIAVNSIKLNKGNINLSIGESSILKATIDPSNASNKNITWTSSDSKIAVVNKDGIVTGIKEGTTSIIAKSNNGKKSTCKVTVKKNQSQNIEVSSVKLNKKTVQLVEGENITLVASINPSDATNKSITWTSSDIKIAKVENGKVTALKEGNASITVTTNNGKTSTCKISVIKKTNTNIEVSNIKLNKTSVTILEGEQVVLEERISPSNATNKKVTWTSSNVNIAKVNDGVVSGLKEGKAKITVKTNNGKTATCEVIVKKKEVIVPSSIKLDKTSITLTEGELSSLKATVLPDNAKDKTIKWESSNIKVAIVLFGEVYALSEGSAKITAKTSNGKTATCEVIVKKKEVKNIEVESVKLNKEKITLTEGEIETLKATISPSDATNKSLTWTSSNTSVALVSDGKVTGLKKGTSVITVKTNNGKTSSCKVEVIKKQNSKVDVSSVTLDKESATMDIDGTLSLKVTVSPSNASNKDVSWNSSDTNIITVDNKGNVKALSSGTATITVISLDNNKKDECVITVKPKKIEATSIKLDKTNETLYVNNTLTLKATITPSNVDNKVLTWTSSDPSIASVDNKGVIKALKVGKTTITAKTSNGKVATCTINVIESSNPVTSITLNKTQENIIYGNTTTLTATVSPSNANDKTITWTSSDNKIATVSSSGVVKALKRGEVTITAKTSNGIKATSKITVIPYIKEDNFPYIYQDETAKLEITKVNYLGKLTNKNTIYYLAHLQITDYSRLKSGIVSENKSSSGEYTGGKVSDAANRENAIFAVEGDQALNGDCGPKGVIRNGKVYGKNITDALNGTIGVGWYNNRTGVLGHVSKLKSKKMQEVLDSKEATDTFCFGPSSLIDGENRAKSDENTINNSGRRQSNQICYKSPGDIYFLVGEGMYYTNIYKDPKLNANYKYYSTDNYSYGLIGWEINEIFKDLGCSYAVPLDAGGSILVWFRGQRLNSSAFTTVKNKTVNITERNYLTDFVYFK